MRSWHDVVIDQEFLGGDVEWVDEETGQTFRGYIKNIRETEGGRMVEFDLGWCARLVLDASGTWHVSSETSFGFDKVNTVLSEGENGVIEFNSPHFAQGTIYPPGRNLDPKLVKGFGHAQGPLN